MWINIGSLAKVLCSRICLVEWVNLPEKGLHPILVLRCSFHDMKRLNIIFLWAYRRPKKKNTNLELAISPPQSEWNVWVSPTNIVWPRPYRNLILLPQKEKKENTWSVKTLKKNTLYRLHLKNNYTKSSADWNLKAKFRELKQRRHF